MTGASARLPAIGFFDGDEPTHFYLKPGSYDTASLIEVLEQMKVFYRGERVVLVWDGLSAH
ncbi:hypothetical protein [Streptomyces sp. NPDC057686]|uniref:hypothetical protein n=1 Tax=Streptomyces sp. NPDC057686 TaxID=3346212 RepID=UPI0036C821A4